MTKHKRFHIIFLIVFFGAFAALKLWQLHWPKAEIQINDERLRVLVAATPEKRFTGLSGRESLAPYDGMLFLFSTSSQYAFVMRDMEFSIDILWIDRGEIVDIAPSLPLPLANESEEQLQRYYPRKPANAVLEVPAGWSEAHEVRIGDRVRVTHE